MFPRSWLCEVSLHRLRRVRRLGLSILAGISFAWLQAEAIGAQTLETASANELLFEATFEGTARPSYGRSIQDVSGTAHPIKDGKVGGGLSVPDSAILFYTGAASGMDERGGKIDFWLRPRWPDYESRIRRVFEVDFEEAQAVSRPKGALRRHYRAAIWQRRSQGTAGSNRALSKPLAERMAPCGDLVARSSSRTPNRRCQDRERAGCTARVRFEGQPETLWIRFRHRLHPPVSRSRNWAGPTARAQRRTDNPRQGIRRARILVSRGGYFRRGLSGRLASQAIVLRLRTERWLARCIERAPFIDPLPRPRRNRRSVDCCKTTHRRTASRG